MSKKPSSGLPVKHKATPLSKATLQKITTQAETTPDHKMQFTADELAKIFQGKVLRWRVVNSQLIVLFKDGRKFYVNLGV